MDKKSTELINSAKDDLATSEFNYEGEKFQASVYFSKIAAEKALLAYVLNKKEEDTFLSIEKILSGNERINRLFAVINISYQESQGDDNKITKDFTEQLIRASQEIIMWADSIKNQ